MNPSDQKSARMLWIARVLAIVFAFFISVFAMDVFSEHLGFWKTLFALIMHLIPSLLIIGLLIFSWRRPWVGGISYTLLGIIYVVSAWGKFGWLTYLLISGPLFILGILFCIAWYERAYLSKLK